MVIKKELKMQKTIKKSATSIDTSIDILVGSYPNGIYHGSYDRQQRAARLPLEAINELVKATHNNKEEFKKLLDANAAFNQFVASRNEKLINNWFVNILLAEKERANLILQKERAKVAEEASKLAALKQRERNKEIRRVQAIKEREARRAAAKKEKAKVKNKTTLWKELNLSAQQKQILRRIAT
jgi:GTPase involved in cell partitioning and DNA repair